MTQDIDYIRRQFMQSMVALPWVAALTNMHSRTAWAATSELITSPYGALVETNDLSTGLPLLKLPPGFKYKSFAWTGDEMQNGHAVPGKHDGMTVVPDPARDGDLWVIRNHERDLETIQSHFGATDIYDTGTTYQLFANGGTTSSLFRNGKWMRTVPSLAGTRHNCAGGGTPWGTWLSCEEVADDAVSSEGKKHGYVFEVQFKSKPSNAVPIVAMGRFKHEAAAVHPASRIVYMTEDDAGQSGLYRYTPNDKSGTIGSLAAQGGLLEMAKVKGTNNADLRSPAMGDIHEIEWVPIALPDENRGTATPISGPTLSNCSGPFRQGYAQGALRMDRGEGAAHHKDRIFIMDTSGGTTGKGAIWALDVLATPMVMTCIYVSSINGESGEHGDNIIVSPRLNAGLIMCEDPAGAPSDEFGNGTRLMGIKNNGDAFIFAKYNFKFTDVELGNAGKSTALAGNRKGGEFCGACWDSTGKWLFVNNQDPGITFAITGPWADGPL